MWRHRKQQKAGDPEPLPETQPVVEGPLKPSDLSRFAEGAPATVDGRVVPVRVRHLGELTLSGAAVVGCDPFELRWAPRPFVQAVPTGCHAVVVSLVEDRFGWERVAAATLQFTDAPVVRLEPALTAGQDPETLAPGEFFGYGVDTGTGCFADPAMVAALLARAGVVDLDEWRGLPASMTDRPDQRGQMLAEAETLFDGIDDQLRAQLDDRGARRDPVMLPGVAPGTTGLVGFEAGFGDGAYPSWFGYSDDDQPVLLLTDFAILT